MQSINALQILTAAYHSETSSKYTESILEHVFLYWHKQLADGYYTIAVMQLAKPPNKEIGSIGTSFL